MFNKNKKTLCKIAMIFAMGAVMALIKPPEMVAQNFVSGPNCAYEAGNVDNTAPWEGGGIIKMKSSAGEFTGVDAEGVPTPTNALGTSDRRIQGTVIWANTGNRIVQDSRFYTHVSVAGGGPKTFNVANISGWFYNNAPDANTILHTANTGNIIYDGTSQQVVLGTASNTNNRYNKFTIASGARGEIHSDVTTGAMDVVGTLRQDVTSTLDITATAVGGAALPVSTISGSFLAETAGNPSIVNIAQTAEVTVTGTVDVAAADLSGGTFTINNNATTPVGITTSNSFTLRGGATMNNGANANLTTSGTFTLADNATMDNKAGANLLITGGTFTMSNGNMINASGATVDVNANFVNTNTSNITNDFSTIPSTFIYRVSSNVNSNADGIWQNASTHPYGRLIVNGKDFELTGNVFISGQVSDALKFETPHKITTAATTGISFGHATAEISHYNTGGNCSQVIGWIDRTASSNNPYTFHNPQTYLTFNAQPTTFGLKIEPGVTPTTATPAGGDPITPHIQRKVTVRYTGTAGIISNMNIGYDAAEELTAGIDKTALRGFKVRNETTGLLLAGTGGGVPWNCNVNDVDGGCLNAIARQTGTINLAGVTTADGVPADGIGSGDEIVFSAVPLRFISHRNGRWSDPGTWNHGMVPSSTDDATIRSIVYTGFSETTGNNFFGATRQWYVSENRLLDNDGFLARELVISDVPVTGLSSALVIGNSARFDRPDADQVNGGTAVTVETSPMDLTKPLKFAKIINRREGTNTVTNASQAQATGATANGILITNGTEELGPELNGVEIINNGRITNRSVLSLGE